MNENKDLILAILAVLVPAIVAFMGYIIHRKTERIKIMENQLSEKKVSCLRWNSNSVFQCFKKCEKQQVLG